MEGAVFAGTAIVNVLDAHGDALRATVLRGENIFHGINLEDTDTIAGNTRFIFCVPVANGLARQGRRKVDGVSREGEFGVFIVHGVSILHGRGCVKVFFILFCIPPRGEDEVLK